MTGSFSERLEQRLAEAVEGEGYVKDIQALRRVAGPATENPVDTITGESVPKWTPDEILTALTPLIQQYARRYSGGQFSRKKSGYDEHAAEDLAQNIALAVFKKLPDDEGRRLENGFLGFILPTIRRAAREGMYFSNFRDARGLLTAIREAKTPEDIRAAMEQVPEQFRQPGPWLEEPRYQDITDENPYGPTAPRIWEFGEQMIQALTSGDKRQMAAVRRQISDYVKFEVEPLATRLPGATTGIHDVASHPRADQKVGDDTTRDFVKSMRRTTGLTVRGEGGEDIDHPGLPPAKDIRPEQGSSIGMLENKALLRDILEAALDGVPIRRLEGDENVLSWRTEKGKKVPHAYKVEPTGYKGGVKRDKQGRPVGVQKIDQKHVVKISIPEFRAIIRRFGLADYPLRDTPQDPELMEDGSKSEWVEAGCPPMSGAETAVEWNVSQVYVSQQYRNGLSKLVDIAAYLRQESGTDLDEGANPGIDAVIAEHLFRVFRTALLESIYEHTYPPVLLS